MWDRKLRADDPWLREKRGERASHLAWPGCSYLRRVGSGDNVSVISADWTVSLIVPLVSECDIWHHDTVWQCLTLSLLTGAYRYHEHELKNKPSSSPAHCSRATIQWNQKPLWVGLMTWCSPFLWLLDLIVPSLTLRSWQCDSPPDFRIQSDEYPEGCLIYLILAQHQCVRSFNQPGFWANGTVQRSSIRSYLHRTLDCR